MEIKLSFGTYEGIIEKYQYSNGRTALQIYDSKTYEPLLTATVNVPEQYLEENEVIIKDYSENKGTLESLIAANVLENTGKIVPLGFIEANICLLLPEENWAK